MNRLRALFRRKKSVPITTAPDFRMLDLYDYDLKVLQSLTTTQHGVLYDIRSSIRSSVPSSGSVQAKLKAIEEATQQRISQTLEDSMARNVQEVLPSLAPTTVVTTVKDALLPPKKPSRLALFSKPPVFHAFQSVHRLAPAYPLDKPLLSHKDMQLVLRLQLCKEYFHTLAELCEKGDVSSELLQKEGKINSLLDAVMLGTSAERIQEHMQLFGEKGYQETLQLCFYSLYEAELRVVAKYFQMYPMQLPQHQKIITKNLSGNTYLLDSLELNTKLRCVLAWMDPAYGGIKPLEDNHNLPMNPDLIMGRRKYFPDGERIPQLFLQYLRQKFREREAESDDNRATLQQGKLFIIGTILLDWLICSI